MVPATQKDKATVISIISDCFWDNPGVNFIIGKKRNKSKRLKALAEYAFDYAFYRKGIFLTKNAKGLAICYLYNIKPKKLYDIWLKAKLVTRAIGWIRILKVIAHTKRINDKRPANGDYLYFWFMGVSKEGRGNIKTAIEIMDYIFNLSNSLKKIVYAETSVAKNMNIYKQLGFQTYTELNYTDTPLNIWCMYREYGKNSRWMR